MMSILDNFFNKATFPEKKVLILEGGGMRGIFPTGVLQAFTDRNFLQLYYNDTETQNPICCPLSSTLCWTRKLC